MKVWLRHANGWQRLWFVGSSLLIFYSVLIFPFTQANGVTDGTSIYLSMGDPKCSRYMTDPIESLNAPESPIDRCYALWRHREYMDRRHRNYMVPVIVPYTEDILAREHRNKWLTEFAIGAAIGAILALIFSGLIYALGTTVRWVIAGFSGDK